MSNHRCHIIILLTFTNGGANIDDRTNYRGFFDTFYTLGVSLLEVYNYGGYL